MVIRKRHIMPMLACLQFVMLFVIVESAFAQNGRGPEWQRVTNVEREAFRYSITVPALSVEVPTVVEVPVNHSIVQHATAVVQDEKGEFTTALYTTTSEVPSHAVSAYVEGNVARYLSDGKIETVELFPFSENTPNTVVIEFRAVGNVPITSDHLFIALAPNVALPTTIAITAVSEGEESVVVAKRKLETTQVRFPETTANTFVVSFELAQPLRVAEMRFAQKGEVVTTGGVRFLAQPEMSYTVYLDPDRTFGVVPTGGVSLESDEGVLRVNASMEDSVFYVPLDTDKDGVADLFDNCVSVANPEQNDVDGNGRGDECDDYDRDGVINSKDNCPDTPNRAQTDTDKDGVGDECDTRENRLTERSPWIPWAGMGVAGIVLIVLLGMSLYARPKDETERENEQEDNNSSKSDTDSGQEKTGEA